MMETLWPDRMVAQAMVTGNVKEKDHIQNIRTKMAEYAQLGHWWKVLASSH